MRLEDKKSKTGYLQIAKCANGVTKSPSTFVRLGNAYFYGVVGQNFADRVQEPIELAVYKLLATSVQPGCLGGV